MGVPLIPLAWRNIWRNRRRSLLTLLAVAVAAAVVVFFRSLQVSSWETALTTSINLFQGALQIQAAGFRERGRLQDSFVVPGEALERLSAMNGVRGVSVRAIGYALLSAEDRSYGASLIGVEPESERTVSTIPGLVRRGAYLSGNDRLEIVLGETLAKNLRVEVGESVTVLGQGRDGSIAATVLTVVGVFQSGAPDLDRILAEVPIRTFEEVFSMEGEVHSVVIAVDRANRVPELRSVVDEEVEGWQSKRPLVVLSWEELLVGLKQAIELDMGAAWLFYLSLVLIVSLSILNTFLMSVVERNREFGVMLALGVSPHRVTLSVLLESVFLTGMGILVGVAFGATLVVYYGWRGFRIPGSEAVMKQWNLPETISPELSASALVDGPALVLLGGLLAALIPAFRAARVDMLRALKQS